MPPRAPVRGLRVDPDLQFAFRPSVGIMAARVDRLGIDIRSFREPLKRSIQQVMAPSFRTNFDVGGRPDSWDPLAEYTVEERGSSQPILVRSGRLKKVVQQFNIWSIDREKAALTDLPQSVWYGKVHQAGIGRARRGRSLRDIEKRAKAGKVRAVNIPQRRFVLIQDPEDYDAIERVFAEWLGERAERVGLNVSRGFGI
jgi:phage gpG-like protein